MTFTKTQPNKTRKATRFFDLPVFLDVVGRIWIIAAFGAAGCLLFSLLITPIARELGFDTCLFGLIDCGYLLPFFAVIFTPVLAVNAFSFLFKRMEADFYDALPYSRTSVYVTTYLAVAAVSFAATLVISVVSVILTLITVPCAVIDFASVMIELCALLFGTLLSAAVTSFGCASSGHRVQAVCTSFVLLFAPSILFSMADSVITSYVPYLVDGKLFMISPLNFNLASILLSSEIEKFYSVFPYLYTAVLAFFYFGVGLRLFVRRKSEAATRAAASDRIRHIFRIGIATLITLPSVIVASAEDFDFVAYGLSLILALLFYFIYELVSTKNLKGTVKTAVLIPIILGIDLLAFLGVTTIGEKEVNFAPDDILLAGVRVLPSESGRLSMEEYVTMRSSGKVITDDIARTIVGDALKEQVNAYQKDRYSYISHDDESVFLQVSVESFGSHVRRIYLSQVDYRILMSRVNDSENYYAQFADLPEKPLKLSDSDAYAALSESELKSVWNAARGEIGEIGGREYLQLIRTEKPDATILYSVRFHGKNYEVILPIFGKMTESAKLYAEAKTEAIKREKQKTTDAANRILAGNLSCSYAVFVGDGHIQTGYQPADDRELLLAATRALSDATTPSDEKTTVFTFTIAIYGNRYEDYQYTCYLSDEDAKNLISFMKNDEPVPYPESFGE